MKSNQPSLHESQGGSDLVNYFDEAFRLARQRPDEHVLEYAVARFDRPKVAPRNWPLLQQLLLQAAVVEPGVIRRIIPQLSRHAISGFAPDRSLLNEVLTELILSHAPRGHGSEVAWAIWGALALGVRLEGLAAEAVVRMSDDVVAVSALHAESEGIFGSSLNPHQWAAWVTAEEMAGEHWLLAYEAARQGWLPMHGKPSRTDALSALLASNVGFYEPRATTPPAHGFPRRAWAVAYV